MAMYVVMSFFHELHPLNLILGLIGGALYLTWSIRTKNRPQIIVNAAGIIVCVMGLVKAWL
jgi:lipid-A-disaccharide synthase-like uncharacterized protein